MSIEYEVRILEVDQKELEEKLDSLGAKKVADYIYQRRVYNFNPVSRNRWIRLRTDGITTTLTIKEIENFAIDGTNEYEIEVSDFEETNRILNKLGYEVHSYQENKRTRYTLDGIEIDIDSWPYIPTYVEIEGKSVQEVEKMIEKLGFKPSQVTSLDVQGVFKEVYKINISDMPEVKFGKVLEEKYKVK